MKAKIEEKTQICSPLRVNDLTFKENVFTKYVFIKDIYYLAIAVIK
jgi:hypothetical protein